MRFERATSGGGPTKWYDIDIISLTGDTFSVVMTYGLKDPQGEDAILQPLKSIFTGPYDEAIQIMLAKIQNREAVGYKKIEPKTEQ